MAIGARRMFIHVHYCTIYGGASYRSLKCICKYNYLRNNFRGLSSIVWATIQTIKVTDTGGCNICFKVKIDNKRYNDERIICGVDLCIVSYIESSE